jgi:hypothetical protein
MVVLDEKTHLLGELASEETTESTLGLSFVVSLDNRANRDGGGLFMVRNLEDVCTAKVVGAQFVKLRNLAVTDVLVTEHRDVKHGGNLK